MIDLKKKYRTRDGREVKYLVKVNNPNYPIVGVVVDPSSIENPHAWTADGLYLTGSRFSAYDLIQVKETVELWVNVYPGHRGYIHASKEKADKRATDNRLACKKITVELDGEMDE